MAIQPTGSGRPSWSNRVSQGSASDSARRGGPADSSSSSDAADRVEISSTARDISGASNTEPVPANELTPERLNDVLGKLKRGFYEQPEVRDMVVRLLSRDL